MGYDYDNEADAGVGVDVSKAMALEEITLDVVKLLRSYFSLRKCPLIEFWWLDVYFLD